MRIIIHIPANQVISVWNNTLWWISLHSNPRRIGPGFLRAWQPKLPTYTWWCRDNIRSGSILTALQNQGNKGHPLTAMMDLPGLSKDGRCEWFATPYLPGIRHFRCYRSSALPVYQKQTLPMSSCLPSLTLSGPGPIPNNQPTIACMSLVSAVIVECGDGKVTVEEERGEREREREGENEHVHCTRMYSTLEIRIPSKWTAKRSRVWWNNVTSTGSVSGAIYNHDHACFEIISVTSIVQYQLSVRGSKSKVMTLIVPKSKLTLIRSYTINLFHVLW